MATPAHVMSEKLDQAQKMRGADIFAEALVRQGVDVMFGYPGGASMELHQSLTRANKIRMILPRFEQGGGFAAQGYARATGKVGLMMATSGPGATNLATVLADAKLDSIPIICITGQVATYWIGRDAFQETDVIGMSRTLTKHNYLLTDPNDIVRVVKEAFYIARTGRPGPVLIDIPKDVQQAFVVPDWDCPMQLPGYNPFPKFGLEEVQRAAELIGEAKKPLLYIGGGCIHAGCEQEVLEMAERLEIPVVTTVMGLGVVGTPHPLYFEMLGMHGSVYANYAAAHADVLIAVGVRFDDRVTGKVADFCKHGKIIHIDIDESEIHKNKPANVPIVGDAKQVMQALLKMVKPAKHTAWAEEIRGQKKKYPYKYDQDPEGMIIQQYVLDQLDELIRDKDVIVTTGVGQHQMWSAQFLHFKKPRTFLTSAGLGTMGFGYPAAMGAKIAFPEKEVIDIDGDGSFTMNVQELGTAYVENIAAKAIVLNNLHLGMVMQWEDRFYDSVRAQTFTGDPKNPKQPYPDFVKIAEGFKVPARRVTKVKEVRPALEEMLAAKTPFVLDVFCAYSEHVLPMIPSGKTFDDIIYE